MPDQTTSPLGDLRIPSRHDSGEALNERQRGRLRREGKRRWLGLGWTLDGPDDESLVEPSGDDRGDAVDAPIRRECFCVVSQHAPPQDQHLAHGRDEFRLDLLDACLFEFTPQLQEGVQFEPTSNRHLADADCIRRLLPGCAGSEVARSFLLLGCQTGSVSRHLQ